MNQLFRREAVSRAPRSLLGSIRLNSPVSHAVWAVFAMGLIASIAAWLLLGTYTRREVAYGTLVPHDGFATVRARAAGEVARLLVSEGTKVSKHQPIAEISSDRRSVGAASSAAEERRRIDLEIASLRSDIASEDQQFAITSAGLAERLLLAQSEIGSAQSQLAAFTEELTAQVELRDRYQALSAGNYISRAQIVEQQSRVIHAKARVSQQRMQIAAIERSHQELRERLSSLPHEHEIRVNEAERRVSQLTKSLRENDLLEGSQLTATRDGVVTALFVRTGDSVSPNSLIATLAPSDSPLVAELNVPSSGIGFVSVGTKVGLRYTAFPYQKFGVHSGIVSSISGSPIASEELPIQHDPRSRDGAPMYRVRVELSGQEIATLQGGRPLLPGMAVEGAILLERRAIYEWVFEPILRVSKKSGADR